MVRRRAPLTPLLLRSVALLALSACHLASDPNPTQCQPGETLRFGKCIADVPDPTVVTIGAAQGGTACGQGQGDRTPVVTPETLTVGVGVSFAFKNDDTIDHELRGTDGTVWTTAPHGRLSGNVVISGKGTFGYTVSGCRGGTVVVE